MSNKYIFPFKDKLVFALVLQDKKRCASLIETILGRKVHSINIVNKIEIDYEKSVIVTPESKYVRLDVMFEDDDTWYDLEMQTTNEGNIPKRSRYIHGILDAQELDPGDDYNNLKASYVIFICCFDPVGKGAPVYFFEQYDRKNDLSLGDDSYTILLNSKARSGDMSEGLRNLFRYINTDEVTEGDSFIEELDEAVRKWNTGDKMDMLLTATQKDQAIREEQIRQEGIAEGMAEGKKEKALEAAKAFKLKNVALDVIAECTGLSIEEVKAL